MDNNHLSEEEMNKIADKVYERLLSAMYKDIGKSVVKKLAWIVIVIISFVAYKFNLLKF